MPIDPEDDSGGRTNRNRPTPAYGMETAEARLERHDRLLVEVFGKNEDGGAFRVMQKDIKKLQEQTEGLMSFRTKIAVLGTVVATIGGAFAGIIAIVIEHYAK